MIEFSAALGLIILDDQLKSELENIHTNEGKVRDKFLNLKSRLGYNSVLSRFELKELTRLMSTRNLIYGDFGTASKSDKLKAAVESNGGGVTEEILRSKRTMSCFGLMAFDEKFYLNAYTAGHFSDIAALKNYFNNLYGFDFVLSNPPVQTDRDFAPLTKLADFFDATSGTPNQIEISESLSDFHGSGWIRPNLTIDIQGGCASSLSPREDYFQVTSFTF